MSTELLSRQILDSAVSSSFFPQIILQGTDQFEGQSPERPLPDDRLSALQREPIAGSSDPDCYGSMNLAFHPAWKEMSAWSRSSGKRFFDCVCVFLALPILVPLLLAVGAAVGLTSRGPVLFLQRRMGRYGRSFTIFKFRTMIHVRNSAHHPITTADNQRFTRIGPFLRRWKLDELPQLANVLLGDMSLVGPRPKLQEHVTLDLPCRPGITGMATNVFASEETVLARVPKEHLDTYYHAIVLPAKRQLDAEYMTRATFFSDLHLLVNSVLRRWDNAALESFIVATSVVDELEMTRARVTEPPRTITRRPAPAAATRTAGAEQVSAF